MRKRQVAIIVLAGWLSLVSVVMLIAHKFDIEIFFVLWLFAFTIIIQFIEPTYVRPGYLKFIKYLMGVGIVMFVVLVVLKAFEILPNLPK